jgi:chorismate mutase
MEELVHRLDAGIANGDQELRHLWREIEEIDQERSVLLGQRLSVLDEVEKYRQEQNVATKMCARILDG